MIGLAILGAAAALTAPAPAACPAGTPIQPITVVNQAHVKPLTLRRVENALVAQSIQVRAAWGTPCVQFQSGGWPLYLVPDVYGWDVHYFAGDTGEGSFQAHTACSRRPDVALPCALVALTDNWTINMSHELVETLEDPAGHTPEICDRYEQIIYRVRGVWMSDFEKPDGSPFI